MAKNTVKVSLIIPTYNEKENLAPLVSKIFKSTEGKNFDLELIIVDDNSPDGTAQLAEELGKKYNIKVLLRKDKRGLSSAVLDGFNISDADIIGVMDADLSHPAEKIPELVLPLIQKKAQIAIGSRYVSEGKIEGWNSTRKLYSKGATLLAKPLTKVKDPMSGFFFLDKNVINKTELNPKGFKILLEILVKGNYTNVIEIPITFQDRIAGKSKLDSRQMYNYIAHLAQLYPHQKRTSFEFIKFCIVGAVGTLINLAILVASVELLHFHYLLGSTIAFLIAATNNFILNKRWTFKDKQRRIKSQYAQFIVVSTAALAVNLVLLFVFVEYLNVHYLLAQILAVLIAMFINFTGNKLWTFRTANQ